MNEQDHNLIHRWKDLSHDVFATLKNDILEDVPKLLKIQIYMYLIKKYRVEPTKNQIQYAKKNLHHTRHSPASLFARAEVLQEIWQENHQYLGEEISQTAKETYEAVKQIPHAVISYLRNRRPG